MNLCSAFTAAYIIFYTVVSSTYFEFIEIQEHSIVQYHCHGKIQKPH